MGMVSEQHASDIAASQAAAVAAREFVLRQFLHDVRSPFQGLMGFAHLLQGDWRDMDGEEVDDCLEQLIAAASQVLATLDEFADGVRGNQQLVLQQSIEASWDGPWRQATGRLWGRLNDRGLKMAELTGLPAMPAVRMDPALVRGALELLINAAMSQLQSGDELQALPATSGNHLTVTITPMPLSPSGPSSPVSEPGAAAPEVDAFALAQHLLRSSGADLEARAASDDQPAAVILYLPLSVPE